jgi:hypothetical protein
MATSGVHQYNGISGLKTQKLYAVLGAAVAA